MVEDEDKPRKQEMMPEDLSELSVEELQDWIAFMTGEIERAKSAISDKRGVRSEADALFSFGKA